MLKKLFNFYVNLYIAEDRKNQKQRVEIRRICFLSINIIFVSLFCISFFTTIANLLGRLFGVIK
jgi:hypothetical protein